MEKKPRHYLSFFMLCNQTDFYKCERMSILFLRLSIKNDVYLITDKLFDLLTESKFLHSFVIIVDIWRKEMEKETKVVKCRK